MHVFQSFLKKYYPALLVFVIFTGGVLARPLLPIDETRYMTVSWEMYLHHNWFLPSLNFEPYHHKPPLLFWLINFFWDFFGVSRWAGALPSLCSAMAVVWLTMRLGRRLFPQERDIDQRAQLVLLGSFPFLIYGSLIMFDVMVCALVLGALHFMLEYAGGKKFRHVFMLGMCLGFGVLAKGPVMYLYTVFPVLFAPLWMKEKPEGGWRSWALGYLLAVLISALPVLVWLVPALSNADGNFAFWLLWNQTAGRITGNFSASHARPVYFYLPLLPVMFMPWIFLPGFTRKLRQEGKVLYAESPAIRFLLYWTGPVFIAFSLISGKQPHYLVPLLPGVALFTAYMLRDVPLTTLRRVFYASCAIFVIGHAVAVYTFFPSYDLRPLAAHMQDYKDKEWAFVRNYHGELGFLARLEKPVTDLSDRSELPAWFKEHHDGYAVIRYKNASDVEDYESLYTQEYRGGSNMAGIFKK